MVESAQQSDVAAGHSSDDQAGHPDTDQVVQEHVDRIQRNPALQPLERRPLRHVHHGQTAAMWVGVSIFFVGFLIGGIAILLGPLWWLFVVGAAIAAVGVIAGKVMQALGFGIYQKQ